MKRLYEHHRQWFVRLRSGSTRTEQLNHQRLSGGIKIANTIQAGLKTIDRVRTSLQAELENTIPAQRLAKWQAEYVAAARSLPESLPYAHLGPELEQLDSDIENQTSAAILELFHKLALVRLIAENLHSPDFLSLPALVKNAAKESFDDIITSVQETAVGKGQFLATRNPWTRYWTYLGIVSMKIHCTGLRIIIPERIKVDQDFCQFAELSMPANNETWVYQAHLYPTSNYRPGMLNREAVTHSLICSGEMLRLRPEFAGLHASNWFHDPRLATVSPHLAFFNQILEEVGVLRRKVDTPPVAIEQALQVSKTRRRLYEAGEYTPQNYEVFYPREPLIRWTDRYRQT